LEAVAARQEWIGDFCRWDGQLRVATETSGIGEIQSFFLETSGQQPFIDSTIVQYK
jgi:hypothetical protein